jgi:hypothetical protein
LVRWFAQTGLCQEKDLRTEIKKLLIASLPG